MTDIAVRQSFTVEEVVPVVLTKAEQTSRVNELGNEIDVAVARITAATERIDEESVVAKLLVARDDIVALQARATSTDYVSNNALLGEALVLAADAISLVEQYVDVEVIDNVLPVEVSTTTTIVATSTEDSNVPETPVAATSTPDALPETPAVAPTSTESAVDTGTSSPPETTL